MVKNLGLCLIGIGKNYVGEQAKSLGLIFEKGLVSSVGSLEVCAGYEAGRESTIHATHKIYKEEESEAILLVDASNAFTSVNRKTVLHNIEIICPPIAK